MLNNQPNNRLNNRANTASNRRTDNRCNNRSNARSNTQENVNNSRSNGNIRTRQTAGMGYNQQYSRRKPAQTRKTNGNDRFLKVLMLFACLLLICLLIFVVCNNINSGGTVGVGGNTDTEKTVGNDTGDITADTSKTNIINTDHTDTDSEEQTTPSEPDYIPEFKSDLSEYESYMDPKGEDRDAYLILVNPWNALTENDVPQDLIDVKSTRKDGRQTQRLRENAAKALEALMIEADACGMVSSNSPSGYPLSVMSAYRDYKYQNTLFNNYVNQEMNRRGISREEAEKIVVTYSCRAGTSEHQTGLCVDMHNLPSADSSFQYQKEAKWLAENSYKFGFVLRFPEGKTDITGITYEPWHFRYVGRYHAKKMYDLGMCLEEYVEYLKKN